MPIASRRGFTLVEILVVTGIVAALAAIVLPVASHARENGRRTTCQSNVRQIAAAMQQYVQDYDGVYPHEKFAYKAGGVTTLVSWQEVLLPYTKSQEVFRCASQPKALPGDSDGYTLNQRVNTFAWSGLKLIVDGKHEAQLPQPSTVWLNVDRISVKDHQCVYCEMSVGTCGRAFYGSTVHGGGGNYSFLDGHAKWYTPNGIAEVDCQNDPLP